MHSELRYEADFYGWIQQQIELLRTRQWAKLETEHLIEELESMGRRDRYELVSHLTILLLHLLKWQFQYRQLAEQWREFEGKSWRYSIIEQRKQIQRQLLMSPSLKSYLLQAVEEAYQDAVELAVAETQLPAKRFPKELPYSMADLLDAAFYPIPQSEEE